MNVDRVLNSVSQPDVEKDHNTVWGNDIRNNAPLENPRRGLSQIPSNNEGTEYAQSELNYKTHHRKVVVPSDYPLIPYCILDEQDADPQRNGCYGKYNTCQRAEWSRCIGIVHQ